MVNRIFKILVLVVFFTINFSIYSQEVKYKLLDPVKDTKNIELHLFVDDIEVSIYNETLNDLENVPLEELDDALITSLIKTNIYQNIEVEKFISKDNKIIFIAKASTIKRVKDVIINGLTSIEKADYLRLLSTQKGQPYNENMAQSDVKKIENILIAHGYLNAKVNPAFIKNVNSDNVQVIFNVIKNNPCRIDQIIVKDSLANILNFLAFPIETGAICDLKSINETLELQKENLYEQGYLQAKVNINNIAYSENKENAKIIIEIDKGSKTIFQIFDEEKGALNNEFSIIKQGLSYSDILLMSDSDLLTVLTNFYQKQGFAFASVLGPEKIVDKNGNITFKFLLKKGSLVKVGKVQFIGELPISESQVLEQIGLGKSLFINASSFLQENLTNYRDKLKNLFFNYGFLDVQIATPDFIPSQDKTEMNLIFRIEKGKKYIVNNIEVKGLPEGFRTDLKKLTSILNLGEPFSYLKRQSYMDEYRRQLLIQGYLYAQIQINQILLEDTVEIRKVNLIVNITPGYIVRIRNIYVDSDIVGKDNAIIYTSGLEEGAIFDQESFEIARLRLLKHDIFSSLAIDALDISAVDRKETRLDVLIRARAKTGYSLGLSPGWSNFRGYVFNTDFSLNKLNDDGLRFFSTASVSQEKQQQSFATTDTAQILGRQVNLGLSESLFKLGPIVTPLDMSSIFGYQVAAESLTNREYLTFQVIAEWKPYFFGLNWNFREAFIYENSKSTSSESAVVQALDSPSILIHELLSSVTLDTRNNLAWPTSGSLYNFQFGAARFGFGSNVQFNRYNISLDSYFPIYKKLSGAISFGGKFITDTLNKDGTTVTPPASRRATLTDSALVRGFPETYGSTAPGPLLWIHYANNGVANCNTQLVSLGATNLMYLKSEMRYRFNEIFGMVFFVDSASNYFTQEEANQINSQINKQVMSSAASSTQCVPDNAALIAPTPIRLQDSDFLKQYWKQAYVSSGFGFRMILGNYATVSLDYGYPLKDPDMNCQSPAEAVNNASAPVCVSRIQDSSYLQGKLQFKGAMHLKIGAEF